MSMGDCCNRQRPKTKDQRPKTKDQRTVSDIVASKLYSLLALVVTMSSDKCYYLTGFIIGHRLKYQFEGGDVWDLVSVCADAKTLRLTDTSHCVATGRWCHLYKCSKKGADSPFLIDNLAKISKMPWE